MSQKRPRSAFSPPPPTFLSRSTPLTDRASRFLALYSPTLPLSSLLAQPELTNATHLIRAWRHPSTQTTLNSAPSHPPSSLFESSHDDDGEKHGGKTLAKVLLDMDVVGTVVVARWYGGVMLGPVRFEHMRTCAREAVEGWKRSEYESEGRAKRIRGERRRGELLCLLPERDRSIGVLRDLLKEKTDSVNLGSMKGTETDDASLESSSRNVIGKETEVEPSPKKKVEVDYSNLPLATLEKLEQVRDATIGWILGRIEKVEKEEEEEEEEKEARRDGKKDANPGSGGRDGCDIDSKVDNQD